MSATTLSRRSMFGMLLGTTATAALSTYAGPALARTSPAADMMIIYVCADDCGPCRVFDAEDLPRWMASPMARTVRLVRAKAPKTTQAFQAKYWPAEARPYMNAFRAPIVPSFMFVANGNVVASGAGLVGWRQTTLPRVQQMAQA